MTKEEYRKTYAELMVPDDWKNSLASFNIVTDMAGKLVDAAAKLSTFEHDIVGDAHLLYNMTVTRGISIKKLVERISFWNWVTKKRHPDFIDPFSIYTLIRSQFEAYCIFNNIYIQHQAEQQEVVYYLWVISGLEYRQRFNALAITPQIQQKVQQEAAAIQSYYNKMMVLPAYHNLDADSKTHLQKVLLKNKNIQGKFLSNISIRKLDWHELFVNAGAKPQLQQLYSFLSLNSHPSNVSVFQFRDVRKGGKDEYAIYALNISRNIMAFFIRDYIIAFPALREEYLKSNIVGQLVIDGVNRLLRGEAYQVSNVLHDTLD